YKYKIFMTLEWQVNALVVPSPSEDSSLDLADLTDGQEVEDLRIFNSIYKALKIALRSLKGLNCVISWVVGIQDNALQFNRDVITCGVTATKDVTNLVNANLKIISTCNSVFTLRSGLCSQADAEESKITNSCFVKVLSKVWLLKKQVDKAVTLAKKLPQTGPNAVVCLNSSVSSLTNYYTQFPQNMVSCSKLTS
ncbi:hypothetical protein KR009_006864, partial [Drosophila setifemur]